MSEETFRFVVKAKLDGAPVTFNGLPVPGRTEQSAQAFLAHVLAESKYTEIEIVPIPPQRAD